MKVKIVVRVSMSDDKSRSKALKTTVGISGVESAALSGPDKDQVVVVGESIDAVELTRQLRKGVGYTELLSVGEDKKEPNPGAKVEAPAPESMVPIFCSYNPMPYQGYHAYAVHETSESSCTIMSVHYVTADGPDQPHPRMAFTGVSTMAEEMQYNPRLTKDKEALRTLWLVRTFHIPRRLKLQTWFVVCKMSKPNSPSQ